MGNEPRSEQCKRCRDSFVPFAEWQGHCEPCIRHLVNIAVGMHERITFDDDGRVVDEIVQGDVHIERMDIDWYWMRVGERQFRVTRRGLRTVEILEDKWNVGTDQT